MRFRPVTAVTAVGAVTALGLAPGPSPAGADSFTPVRLSVTLSPIARRNGPLPITVALSADAAALDARTGPLRVRVRLAAECGGDFSHTVGSTLLDAPLWPQPSPGRPYSGQVAGAGHPTRFGVFTACVYLEDADGRQFVTESDLTVDVSSACTRAAARFDAAQRAGRRSKAARRSAVSYQRAARHACGSELPL